MKLNRFHKDNSMNCFSGVTKPFICGLQVMSTIHPCYQIMLLAGTVCTQTRNRSILNEIKLRRNKL